MFKTHIFLGLVLSLFLITAVACEGIQVVERDTLTIANFEFALENYKADVARAAGVSDRELEEADFPVGSLTWDEYHASIEELKSAIAREKAKKTLEEANAQ